MTITTFTNGTTIQNSSHADALADLFAEFPDMVLYNNGHRTFVWANEASAENDPGQHAVAQLTVIQ
jgi:hypothetical protein